MQASTLPMATRQRIQVTIPTGASGTANGAGGMSPAGIPSAGGLVSVHNSWSSKAMSAGGGAGGGLFRTPLAWAGVRHEIAKAGEEDERCIQDQNFVAGHCNQVVLLTCLHLSHGMALREVGLYGWTLPHPKDPAGSMLRVMQKYTAQIQSLDPASSINVRSAPDPSKKVIKHHLTKARLAAGPDSYLAVIYSGHGIQEPPTEAGELWCYDRSFEECAADGGTPSEYIPILLFDLLTWAGASTCYVWDCQHAGRFIQAAKTEAAEIDSQLKAAALKDPNVAELHPPVYIKQQIHLAACGADQVIPKIPGLPDDLFTACLTTPTRIALLYHNLQTFPLTTSGSSHHYIQRAPNYMAALWDNMSASLRSRLWSELQAILHTIAWQSMPSKDYHILFGQNLDAVSTMAGGFLLSQRVLGTYRTIPESVPHIPSSTCHPLWTHWDLILDKLFEQLPEYFDTTKVDTSWEDNIKLVSFMQDQLGSILTSNQGLGVPDFSKEGTDVALSRLPIICQAACTSEFREEACNALQACLTNLDLPGLDHAVNCGTLDVAVQLLALEDPSLSSQMISIWASLIRHPACVKRLAKPAKESSVLVEVPCINFFLSSLETHLEGKTEQSNTTVIQTAAILSTIIDHIYKRIAPNFLARSLSLCSTMLQSSNDLVQQWGALFIAELLSCLEGEEGDPRQEEGKIQEQLFLLAESKTVETRAASIYALSRWIPTQPVEDLLVLRPEIAMASKFVQQAYLDASQLVRKELVNLFTSVMCAAGHWGTFTVWAYLVQEAIDAYPKEEARIMAKLHEMAQVIKPGQERHGLMEQMDDIIVALARLHQDPARSISTLVTATVKALAEPLRGSVERKQWERITMAAIPKTQGVDLLKLEDVEVILQAGEAFCQQWQNSFSPVGRVQCTFNKELFQKSKLSLRSYIKKDKAMDIIPAHLKGQPQNAEEKTWILRNRALEDSLVVAEQQMGLPWKWKMKDISSPDPWSSLTCHSFHTAVMSCNNSHDILLWDWASARKTGNIHLELASNAYIKSARFVNELHPTTVVLAEINNGDIYVFAGPPTEPTQMKLISSFAALNLNKYAMKLNNHQENKIVSTWWRQSGLLAVGGASRQINVWDCPAEQMIRVWETEEEYSVTTLITEPKQGNLFLAGFANGKVKLFDQREAKNRAVLSWQGDLDPKNRVQCGKAIIKTGIVLGESKNFTSACANGMLNVHDVRNLRKPATSILAHPSGISDASFQAHSGLMSTISNLNPPSKGLDPVQPQPQGKPYAKFAIYRSVLSTLSSVTEDTIIFDPQQADVALGSFQPYTFIHPLRPFLSLGYGRTCHLRGSGIGEGDTTDSGSYSFLKAQAKFIEG